MTNRILLIAIAVIFTGCAHQMKQDPKKLEEHCQLEAYKDAPICKYLSAKDQEMTNALAAMSAPRLASNCKEPLVLAEKWKRVASALYSKLKAKLDDEAEIEESVMLK